MEGEEEFEVEFVGSEEEDSNALEDPSAQEALQEPNTVLRVTVEHMIHEVTHEKLFEIFSRVGQVSKISIWTENDEFEALVEYEDVVVAQAAKMTLDGQNICNACCCLRIEYTEIKNWRYMSFDNPRLPTAPNLSSPIVDEDLSGPSDVNERKCKVICRYVPQREDELALKVGDVVVFLEEVEKGWWKGILGNKVGMFPSNYVEIIDPEGGPVSPATGNHDPVGRANNIDAPLTQGEVNGNSTQNTTTGTLKKPHEKGSSGLASSNSAFIPVQHHLSKAPNLSSPIVDEDLSGPSGIPSSGIPLDCVNCITAALGAATGLRMPGQTSLNCILVPNLNAEATELRIPGHKALNCILLVPNLNEENVQNSQLDDASHP